MLITKLHGMRIQNAKWNCRTALQLTERSLISATPLKTLPGMPGTQKTARALATMLSIPEAGPTRQQLWQQISALQGLGYSREVAELKQYILQGVGFHHADLPKAVKQLVEAGVRSGGVWFRWMLRGVCIALLLVAQRQQPQLGYLWEALTRLDFCRCILCHAVLTHARQVPSLRCVQRPPWPTESTCPSAA